MGVELNILPVKEGAESFQRPILPDRRPLKVLVLVGGLQKGASVVQHAVDIELDRMGADQRAPAGLKGPIAV